MQFDVHLKCREFLTVISMIRFRMTKYPNLTICEYLYVLCVSVTT